MSITSILLAFSFAALWVASGCFNALVAVIATGIARTFYPLAWPKWKIGAMFLIAFLAGPIGTIHILWIKRNHPL